MLLGFMLLVGAVSGLTGYGMGHQSLRGITQPALNPVLNSEDGSKRRPQQETSLLSEKEIVAKAQAKTSGVKKPKAQKPKPSPKPKTEKKEDKAEKQDSTPQSFPVKAEQKGMTLEVRSLAEDEDGLVLNVTLQNGGSKPVQFVYEFLDVTDNRGRSLLAEAQGLPSEFQANSETFYGTIKILDVSGDDIEKVSLKLADYPDQAIKLEAANIPILE